MRVLGLIAVLALAACSSGTATPGLGSPAPAGSGPAGSPVAGAIAVTLQEWAVLPAQDSVAAGDVTFQVSNTGPEDVHEFVVLKTDLDPAALPTDDTGTVDEAGAGIEVVDEIEDIPVGESQELTVPLQAGTYVLLCNIYDETEQEAHYTLGLRTSFTVE